jgi:hypothetical protein
MEQGVLKEFDSPNKLLDNRQSMFSALVDKSVSGTRPPSPACRHAFSSCLLAPTTAGALPHLDTICPPPPTHTRNPPHLLAHNADRRPAPAPPLQGEEAARLLRQTAQEYFQARQQGIVQQ